MRFYIIRDLVKRGTVAVKHVDNETHRADFLKKPLAADKFFECRNVLMNV